MRERLLQGRNWMASKDGKIFEANLEDSIKSCKPKIFYSRIKDTFIPFELRGKVRTSKNPYDCLMYSDGHLFTFELKSTESKSVSFSESIIKEHQITNLQDANLCEGVISGFIFNFRIDEPKTYFIHIEDFMKYKLIAQAEFAVHSYKSKINKSSMPLAICEEIGIEIKSTLKKVNYRYHMKEFIIKAISKYGAKVNND
jgi:penicillin-binding protein-related factor A (putative recombinase)